MDWTLRDVQGLNRRDRGHVCGLGQLGCHLVRITQDSGSPAPEGAGLKGLGSQASPLEAR